jgi:hypothetical protein
MKILQFKFSILFVLASSLLHAQIEKGNIIKYNFSGLAVKYHAVQFERVISPKQSFAVTAGFSPSTSLPFKERLIELYGNDAQARTAIESTSFQKFTLTAEYRLYVSGKAPQGFYLAPFARYSKMTMSQHYSFVDSDNTTHNPLISGNFTGFGGGLLAGAQWTLGKAVVIDLWLAGPFIGTQKASFNGINDRAIINTAGLEADIEAVDIPLWDLEATVSNQAVNGANKAVMDVNLTGPFVGIRMLGLTVGIRL